MEPSEEKERMKRYSVLLPPEATCGETFAHTQKKQKKKKKKVERTTTHCRTRGWWSVVVSSSLLFAVSVISLVYFKRERERTREVNIKQRVYNKRLLGFFFLSRCAKKKKKKSVDQENKKNKKRDFSFHRV